MSKHPTRVHLLFKTHLDLGFTELAHTVTASYFEEYIPHALRVAQELRRAGGPERFVWTTGSWLIYEYLERATPDKRAELEQAIRAGDIVWHGLPFTTHSELMDAGLFRFGLSLSHELDARYGKHTIAAKMTDVPGHTRGIVPLLAEAEIKFLHLGVNPASTPPAVPPVFVWRAPDGSDVIVMYQKGSYGGLQTVPGLDEALAFAHTDDNLGPQNVEQVRAAFAKLRAKFPDAEIVASTMDAFAEKLAAVKAHLPVVTQEMGDTWIHGAGTDPQKLSQFRALLDLRRIWLGDKRVDSQSTQFKTFSRALLKIPEHTWGLDVKTHLADYENYSSELFRAARVRPNFQKIEASWQEQRAYVTETVDALGDSLLGRQAKGMLQLCEPMRPNTSGLVRAENPLMRFETTHWQFQFDNRGALVHLVDKEDGKHWASPSHPLGLMIYETFSQADYDRFYKQYIVAKPENTWWAVPDFTKPGMALAGAEHRDWYPQLVSLHTFETEDLHYLLELKMPEAAVSAYGCPATISLLLTFGETEPSIRFWLQYFDKPASRLPEAIWFSFNPKIPAARGWTMDKLGQTVSPLDVIRDGNRHLHAVGRGIHYQHDQLRFEIETRDAPLVAAGDRSLLNFNNRQPALKHGMHFLLYNNVWGTNFPMWSEDAARFDFVLRPLSSKAYSVTP